MTGHDLIAFVDGYITRNETNEPWSLSDYQRKVILLMFAKHYSIRLWSEGQEVG